MLIYFPMLIDSPAFVFYTDAPTNLVAPTMSYWIVPGTEEGRFSRPVSSPYALPVMERWDDWD